MLQFVYLNLFKTNLRKLLLPAALFIVPSAAPFLGVLLFFMLLSAVLRTEMENNTDILYRSLPISPVAVVKARYLAAFSIAVGVQLAGYVLYLVLFRQPGADAAMFFKNREGMAYFIFFLMAFYLPAYHRFGYFRGMVAGFLSMWVFTVLLSGLLYVYLSLRSGIWALDRYTVVDGVVGFFLVVWEVFGKAIAEIGTGVFRVGTIILLVLLMWASLRLSIRFFRDKDI